MSRSALAFVLASLVAFGLSSARSRAQEPAPSPPASASPAPSGSPSSAESPSPAASGSPVGVPIVVDRVRVGIVPGTTVVVNVSGGTGAIAASASGANVEVRYDPVARRATLVGRAPGSTTVTFSDAFGSTASVAVLVAPPAGVVPSDVTVELGGFVSPAFVAAKIEAAVAADAQLRPGTHVEIHDATPGAALQPGSAFEATAHVRIDGGGAYVDALGTTSVHLRVEALARLDPEILFYSDDPEKLLAGTDGVLYRSTLDAAKPARTYFYHVAYGSTHRLFLALRATAANARVQVLGYAAGPSNAFAYVGHVSTLQYLLERHAQESAIVDVGADAPYLQPLGTRSLRTGELVAGALDLRVLSGGPVDVELLAVPENADPSTLLGGTELPTDGHGRRGEFDLTTVPPLALAYAAGAPDPPPFSIGAPTIANLRAGGRALGGDYGVLRPVSLALSNPGALPATAYLYEFPAGGSATTTIWFATDPAPTEIPCVIRQNRYTIARFDLAPGETRTVAADYMTDGASSFPLLFGLTSVPPSPPPDPYSPDACNPRSPPPATPEPSESSAASPSAAPSPSPSRTPSPTVMPSPTATPLLVPPPPPVPPSPSPAVSASS